MKYNKNTLNKVYQEKIFKNLYKQKLWEYFPPILKIKIKEKESKVLNSLFTLDRLPLLLLLRKNQFFKTLLSLFFIFINWGEIFPQLLFLEVFKYFLFKDYFVCFGHISLMNINLEIFNQTKNILVKLCCQVVLSSSSILNLKQVRQGLHAL